MESWIRVVLEDAVGNQSSLPDTTLQALRRIHHLLTCSTLHPFRTARLEELANEISICERLEDLSEILWEVAISTGFQHFSIFVLKHGSNVGFQTRLCTSYPDEWLRTYQKESYQYVDPVMHAAMNSLSPIDFIGLSSSAPMVKEFWKDADRHRIGRNGLCFPKIRSNGCRIGVSFSTADSNENAAKHIQLNAFDLQFISLLASEAFYDISSYSKDWEENPLSDAELRLLYNYSTSPTPSEAISASPSFGGDKDLLRSIRKKLGVRTIFQALSIAASNQWYDALKYEQSDLARAFPSLELYDADEPSEGPYGM